MRSDTTPQSDPGSRQMESGLYDYDGWDPYWGGSSYGTDAIAAPFSSRPYFGGFGMARPRKSSHVARTRTRICGASPKWPAITSMPATATSAMSRTFWSRRLGGAFAT
jgi:hypothetical protein